MNKKELKTQLEILEIKMAQKEDECNQADEELREAKYRAIELDEELGKLENEYEYLKKIFDEKEE